MTRRQLEALKEIQQLKFTVLEFNLYLNTHREDRKALKKFNEAVKDLNSLRRDYQSKYGLLNSETPSKSPWQYPQSPWPWQIKY